MRLPRRGTRFSPRARPGAIARLTCDFCCERFRLNQTIICDKHANRKACPDAMILEVRGRYGLPVRDGRAAFASSDIEISFCPFCGTQLPPIGDLED
ncbi:DUF6980 family protein [Erythrobacter sanguineus]|uniref:DUF6980 family protein n=1 Tax=Erythrobacter sanguineus TaxID=198312 RepID=UPI003CCC1E48